MVDLDASKPQVASFHQAMNIVAEADTEPTPFPSPREGRLISLAVLRFMISLAVLRFMIGLTVLRFMAGLTVLRFMAGVITSFYW